MQGKTLATAESCTGGGIGAALTAVPGSSSIYKGGVISYTNEVKTALLGVPCELLQQTGAVSNETAQQMAQGVRKLLATDVAVSVTGLAGPGGDEFGNPVGTVYVGYCDALGVDVRAFRFDGNREAVRSQTIDAALKIIIEHNR